MHHKHRSAIYIAEAPKVDVEHEMLFASAEVDGKLLTFCWRIPEFESHMLDATNQIAEYRSNGDRKVVGFPVHN